MAMYGSSPEMKTIEALEKIIEKQEAEVERLQTEVTRLNRALNAVTSVSPARINSMRGER
jgi:uncharacterized coiled-coil protein SlyX